jgi:hypothetical protein
VVTHEFDKLIILMQVGNDVWNFMMTCQIWVVGKNTVVAHQISCLEGSMSCKKSSRRSMIFILGLGSTCQVALVK